MTIKVEVLSGFTYKSEYYDEEVEAPASRYFGFAHDCVYNDKEIHGITYYIFTSSATFGRLRNKS